jgi:hypothetical protein
MEQGQVGSFFLFIVALNPTLDATQRASRYAFLALCLRPEVDGLSHK